MLRAAFAGTFAAVLVGMGAGLAHATTLPDPIYYNVVNVTHRSGPQESQGSALATGGLLISGTQDNLPFPVSWAGSTSNDFNVPTLYASARNVNSQVVEAESSLTYYVEFTGNTSTVPVHIEAHGDTSAGEADGSAEPPHNGEDRSTAFAAMHRADDPFAEVFRVAANTDAAGDPGSHLFTIDQLSTLQTGIVYEILIYASAHVEGNYFATAFVDPYFTVPDGYSISTSLGIGNALAATTPIPAALPLFATGLGALGFAVRRRKKAIARA
jgi:hypothetical protein